MTPVGKQPHLAIIFRGKGVRISEDERKAWHQDIDVYFQTNAWADTEFSLKWLDTTLKPFVKDLDRYFLICDNLGVQGKTRTNVGGSMVWLKECDRPVAAGGRRLRSAPKSIRQAGPSRLARLRRKR